MTRLSRRHVMATGREVHVSSHTSRSHSSEAVYDWPRNELSVVEARSRLNQSSISYSEYASPRHRVGSADRCCSCHEKLSGGRIGEGEDPPLNRLDPTILHIHTHFQPALRLVETFPGSGEPYQHSRSHLLHTNSRFGTRGYCGY